MKIRKVINKSFDNSGHFSSKKFKQQKEDTKACRHFRKNWKNYIPADEAESNSKSAEAEQERYCDNKGSGLFNTPKIGRTRTQG